MTGPTLAALVLYAVILLTALSLAWALSAREDDDG